MTVWCVVSMDGGHHPDYVESIWSTERLALDEVLRLRLERGPNVWLGVKSVELDVPNGAEHL